MDRSGRGFNPRPAQGLSAFCKQLRYPLSVLCLLPSPLDDGSANPLSRSGVEPPTGKLHPRQISVCAFESGKLSIAKNLLIDFYFLSSVPLFSRGWIVPVGGSTPDRLKIGSRAQGLSAFRKQLRYPLSVLCLLSSVLPIGRRVRKFPSRFFRLQSGGINSGVMSKTSARISGVNARRAGAAVCNFPPFSRIASSA